ncbi:cysteine desulfurase [Gordonia araii NBRC 100433]|uniref:Cysteine desulfurase n=1 Tax=Gordonia araii NBRC 100433 TaxID=1073574 RepID=G7H4A8_9ACTN|nr:cysteine desulfurase family protein [Gordonia araii]NNG96259.1 cysteine desulfurase [Gordonia araii NBRC 100433]GAB10683.1 cysteine desulfurase [Gordonia araii NBRC 100433]
MSTAPVESVYLDNAASMAMRPEAVAAMVPALAVAGNPSSLHRAGRSARRHLEEARESVAVNLGARPSEVVFTSGGTESDNLALAGIFAARRREDPRRRRVVISAVEHHAVLDPAQALVADIDDAELVVIGVDADGFLDLDALRGEVEQNAEDIAVISVMWANNEVGTVQPIDDVAAIGREYGIPVHSDAVQAVGHIPVDFTGSGLAALSLAGHKFGGPQGIGALVLGRDVTCRPLVRGGGHERDLRSGTQTVAGAVGMAAALAVATANLELESATVAARRDRLFEHLLAVAGTRANGPRDSRRLPGNAHVSFDGCEGDSLLMLLDAQGIECSTGSACTAGVAQASHVLLAMGLPMATARGSLRFSLSQTTTDDDVDRVGGVIGDVVARARAAGLVTLGGRP